jgi:GlpG protein
MRYLAQIEGKQRAEAFVAYLLTQSISTHIEGAAGSDQLWDVWIRDEDALGRAQAELEQFKANPSDAKYAAAVTEARQIIKQKQDAAKVAAKNLRPVAYRGPNTLSGGRLPPLTLTLLIICIAVSLLTNFMEPSRGYKLGHTMIEQLSFVSTRDFQESGNDPAASLKRGEIWRAVTPVFMHGSPIHLAMNMLALVMLGRITERLVGTPRYALMILLLAALPMLLACLMPPQFDGSPFTIGISGVDYGLVAFLWIVSMQRPELGFRIPGSMIALLLGIIVLGFAGLINGLSNWGHLGGFVVGLALALVSTRGR